MSLATSIIYSSLQKTSFFLLYILLQNNEYAACLLLNIHYMMRVPTPPQCTSVRVQTIYVYSAFRLEVYFSHRKWEIYGTYRNSFRKWVFCPWIDIEESEGFEKLMWYQNDDSNIV